ASIDVQAIATANWGLDFGIDLMTNGSEAIDLGGLEELEALYGTVLVGQPVPAIVGRRVVNPDEIADPIIEEGHYYGPMMPTRTASLTSTLRMPYGIALSATGEYRGGLIRHLATRD